MQTEEIEFNAVDDFGFTLLHPACYCGQNLVVELYKTTENINFKKRTTNFATHDKVVHFVTSKTCEILNGFEDMKNCMNA